MERLVHQCNQQQTGDRKYSDQPRLTCGVGTSRFRRGRQSGFWRFDLLGSHFSNPWWIPKPQDDSGAAAMRELQASSAIANDKRGGFRWSMQHEA